MKVTQAHREANARYDKTHTKQIALKFNLTTDADILQRLEEVSKDPGGKQGYIKRLIRNDMKQG